MASIDTLPPDQRAVLELVLRRGRSYDEIAQLLSIDRSGVRERALAALDALGPRTRVPAERRALITDYLLGALPEGVAAEVREHLGESASERAWARAVGSELQGLSDTALPEIPGDTQPRARPAAAAPAAAEPIAPEPVAAGTTAGESPPPRRSSRLGGAVLLGGGAAIVVALVLVLLLSGGGSSHKPARSAARSSATTPAPSTGATGTTGSTRVLAQINLKPPAGGARPAGIAEVLQAQGKVGVAIVAQGLAANAKHPPNAYAVWLYNSPTDSRILGFVNPAVSSNGQLKTAGGLPSNASHYQKLLVTLETQSNPRAPGQIILEGPLTGV
jgi:hypothetical protein